MPIRRYLRVSKYTVLETQIYLDDPTLLSSWFLNPRDPILPKVVEVVRGLVLPKLREETERVMRGGAKGKRSRAVKDVVIGDGFEVTVVLTEGGTRHAVLSKTRVFQAPQARIKSNSSKLYNVTGDTENEDVPIRAESEESTELQNIPMLAEAGAEDDGSDQQGVIMVESSDEEGDSDGRDEKKPLSRTTYDGFSIYSRALCLVVKKLDTKHGGIGSGPAKTGVPLPEIDTYAVQPRAEGSHGMMEDWITMTQIARQDQDAGEI